MGHRYDAFKQEFDIRDASEDAGSMIIAGFVGAQAANVSQGGYSPVTFVLVILILYLLLAYGLAAIRAVMRTGGERNAS